MTTTNLRLYIFLLPVLFFFIPGCAVMKVDVDVYKGPLANHKDVQTERMAAMAIGAKPLLLDLRKKLLLNDCFNKLSTQEKDGVINIDTLRTKGCKPTQSLIKVNAILSLYEDKPEGELEILSSELRRAYDRLEEAYNNYKDSQTPDSTSRWKNLLEGSDLYDCNGGCKETKTLDGHFFVKNAADENKSRAKIILKKLCEGYKNYFNVLSLSESSEWTWKEKIPIAHKDLSGIRMKPGKTSPLEELDDAFEKYGADNKVSEGATTGYYSLAKRDLAEAHAELFFPKNAAAQKDFADRVTRIAGGFNDSVAQTNTIMRLALKALVGINSGKKHLTDIQLMSAIDIVTGTISKKRLLAIVNLAVNKPNLFNDRYHLKSIITLKKHLVEEASPIVSNNILPTLKMVLQKHPAETAMSLLIADNFFKENDLLKDVANIKIAFSKSDDFYILKRQRRYGLTAEPTEKAFNLQEIGRSTKKFTAGLSGLEGGRLSKGLVHLIDDYLDASDGVSGRCRLENCPEQDRLVGALVRFSEKVLFIANYSQLVEHDKDKGTNDERIKQYTMILQAVGNAILNQADEFHHRSSYGKHIVDRNKIEALALKSASLQDPLVFFSHVINDLQTQSDSASATYDTKAEKLAKAKAEVEAAKEKVVAKIPEAATNNVSKLEGELAPLQTKKTKASNVLNKLGEAWAVVSAQIGLTDRKSIEEVKGMLRTELMKKLDQAPYNDALSALNKIITPATPIPYAADAAKDSKEVLDLLIATLSHNHIESIRLYGSADARTVHYSEAIETARRYRSHMVYIRPSSAYLKSSYPSTSLQNNADLQWKNMLSKHGKRSFFGCESGSFRKEKKRHNRTIGDIDKQFWQNINSVRVAGGGNTNYVIAKDDIGNWYVKAYSADPKPIIDSASKLAMFNMGAATKSDILVRLTSTKEKKKAAVNSQMTVLEKLFYKHQTRYKESTAKTYDAMIKDRDEDTLTTDINNSWNGNEDTAKLIETLKPVIDGSGASLKETLTKTLKADPEKSDEQGVKITIAFGDIRRFHNTLSSAIHNLKLTKAPTEAVALAKKDKENAEADLTKARKELEEKEAVRKDKKLLLKTWEDIYAEKSAANNAAKDTTMDDTKTERDDAQTAVEEANAEVTAATEKVTAAETEIETKEKSYNQAVEALESTEKGEAFALSETTRITREMLTKLLQQRETAVDDYMKSITFIGEANSDK